MQDYGVAGYDSVNCTCLSSCQQTYVTDVCAPSYTMLLGVAEPAIRENMDVKANFKRLHALVRHSPSPLLLVSSRTEMTAPTEELAELLRKKAISRVLPREANEGFYCCCFLTPKKTGRTGPILDLCLFSRHLLNIWHPTES